MRLLLTSGGIKNASLRNTLVDLLGKPIEEASALFIPTGIYPFRGGAGYAWQAMFGKGKDSLFDLGWKSMGILELTALPTIKEENWAAGVREADALLVWGGDPLYISYWMRQSGLAALMPSLRPEMVYVGVSAGSIAATSTFGETYVDPPDMTGEVLESEQIVFETPQGEIHRTLVKAKGLGLVDFAIIPHLNNEHHADASLANAEKWAARLPVPMYAIDDQTAISVVDGAVDVVTEGRWKLFNR